MRAFERGYAGSVAVETSCQTVVPFLGGRLTFLAGRLRGSINNRSTWPTVIPSDHWCSFLSFPSIKNKDLRLSCCDHADITQKRTHLQSADRTDELYDVEMAGTLGGSGAAVASGNSRTRHGPRRRTKSALTAFCERVPVLSEWLRSACLTG